MKNSQNWKPTKYELRSGRLRASRDPKRVAVSSRWMVDLIANEFTRLIPEHCSGHLLDLGCGHVPLYEFFKPHVDEVTCVDWAESLHQNEFLDLVHDLTQPLPLSSELFDTIICSDVMEHIPNPNQLWREIARIMKPGGKLLLSVPFLYCVHEAPYDFHRYTAYALARYCAENQFEVIEIKPTGGAADVVADVSAKVFARVPLVGGGLAVMAQSCAKLLNKLRINVLPHQFPLAYFVVAQKKPTT